MAAQFTVFNYDRRGRGDSGDTLPFSVDREYDDLAAVIAAAGGSAFVYGTSGGAVIALEAAARGLGVIKLGLWEPPYVLDDETTRPRPPADYEARLAAAVAAQQPGQAVDLFFTQAVGMPPEFVAPMHDMPFWPAMEELAQALVYDAALMGDFRPSAERLAKVEVPTLVVDGGTVPWMSHAANAVAMLAPRAQRHTLAGEPHNVDPTAIAPLLADFFATEPTVGRRVRPTAVNRGGTA
jgi:alpha-beta hydrolase superfamily lysophospholipase